MNAGSLSAGQKPSDMTGMAMTGMLGAPVAQKAGYSGGEFLSKVNDTADWGQKVAGETYVQSGYSPAGVYDVGARGWFEAQTNPNIMLAAPNVTGFEKNLELNKANANGVIETAVRLSPKLKEVTQGLQGVDRGITVDNDKSPIKKKN